VHAPGSDRQIGRDQARRNANVHDRDIRGVSANGLTKLVGVRGLRDDFESPLRDHAGDAFPEQHGLVGDHNPHGISLDTCASSHSLTRPARADRRRRLERFLSVVPNSACMTKPHDMHVAREELDLLFTEIRLYLEAVETFRSEGREPIWKRDVPTAAP
jgi:hypothetical protein